MRKFAILLAFFVAACGPSEPEVVTTSVDVDMDAVPRLVAAVNALTDNELDLNGMVNLAVSTPLDQEQQTRFKVTYQGNESEMQFHIWREQAEWVHVYFSSTDSDLIDAIKAAGDAYSRVDQS